MCRSQQKTVKKQNVNVIGRILCLHFKSNGFINIDDHRSIVFIAQSIKKKNTGHLLFYYSGTGIRLSPFLKLRPTHLTRTNA